MRAITIAGVASIAPATVLALALVWLLGVCSVPEVRVYLSRAVDRDHHTRAVYLLTTIGLEGAGIIILRALPHRALALALGAVGPLVAMCLMTVHLMLGNLSAHTPMEWLRACTSADFGNHLRDTLEFCLLETWLIPIPAGMASGAILLWLVERRRPATHDAIPATPDADAPR